MHLKASTLLLSPGYDGRNQIRNIKEGLAELSCQCHAVSKEPPSLTEPLPRVLRSAPPHDDDGQWVAPFETAAAILVLKAAEWVGKTPRELNIS